MTPTHHTETEREPMTEEQVVALMRSSASEDEWAANCDRVKAAGGLSALLVSRHRAVRARPGGQRRMEPAGSATGAGRDSVEAMTNHTRSLTAAALVVACLASGCTRLIDGQAVAVEYHGVTYHPFGNPSRVEHIDVRFTGSPRINDVLRPGQCFELLVSNNWTDYMASFLSLHLKSCGTGDPVAVERP